MQHRETIYEIRIEGQLEVNWCDWFDSLEIIQEDESVGESATILLRIKAVDPSALHGVLAQIGSLNICLISVERKQR